MSPMPALAALVHCGALVHAGGGGSQITYLAPGLNRLQMQISRERIHLTIQGCRSGLLAAYQYLTRVNCLHVNAHLFCLSYRLSTRAELDPG